MKKHTLKVLFLFLLAGILPASSVRSTGAFAATFEKEGEGESGPLYVLEGDKKIEVPYELYIPVQAHAMPKSSATFFTVLISEETIRGAKILARVKPGLYFLDAKGREFGYLDIVGEPGTLGALGAGFVRVWNEKETRVYGYPGLKQVAAIHDSSGVRMVSDGVVAYTLTSREKNHVSEGREGWSSVAAAPLDAPDKAVIIAQATATEDYVFVRLDDAGIFIQKEYVGNESEWADRDEMSDDNPVKTDFQTAPVPEFP
jgi:hypothetical protein